MDEPEWDDAAMGEPDWVLDGPGAFDRDGNPDAADDRPNIAAIREQHRQAYARWTRQADAELVTAYLAGRSIEQLAADFERQPSAIQRRLERLAFAAMTRRRVTPQKAEPD
jgi:hypothetical protein